MFLSELVSLAHVSETTHKTGIDIYNTCCVVLCSSSLSAD